MGHALLCKDTAVYCSHWMPLHGYLRRTNFHSPSRSPTDFLFYPCSTLSLHKVCQRAHSRETTFWFTRTGDLSQFSIHGAVGGASPRASARSTAHFLDQRPILSVSEHQRSPKNTIWSTPNSAEPNGGQQDFMCKNRWCSGKPKNGAPKLSTLQWTNHAEVDIFCSDHDSKQTQREFSSVAAVSKKLCAL